jgi:hypothetical protein
MPFLVHRKPHNVFDSQCSVNALATLRAKQVRYSISVYIFVGGRKNKPYTNVCLEPAWDFPQKNIAKKTLKF